MSLEAPRTNTPTASVQLVRAGERIPLTRGAWVRFTTDRLSDQGVEIGSGGMAVARAKEARFWKVSTGGEYVDAFESDFVVIRDALEPRGVLSPR
jgi:hypothetical protein